jgi:hypothetical protein
MNALWVIDFMRDMLYSGRVFRTVNVIDGANRGAWARCGGRHSRRPRQRIPGQSGILSRSLLTIYELLVDLPPISPPPIASISWVQGFRPGRDGSIAPVRLGPVTGCHPSVADGRSASANDN